jgi:hypothetical protein
MGVRRLGVLVVAALAFLPSAGLADNPMLVGTVGPGFSISLADAAGQPVSNVDAGAYTVQVHDQSTVHSFHLVGPGVDQATEVETLSDPTWAVTLTAGTYTFYCDAHPTSLRGTFTVGTAPPPPPPPPVPKLLGKVGPGAKISLTHADGARARALSPGVYSLTVRDLSAKDNFHLTGPGVSRKTGIAQKRTVTWKLTLRLGTYRYRSDAHAKLKGNFIVVSQPG